MCNSTPDTVDKLELIHCIASFRLHLRSKTAFRTGRHLDFQWCKATALAVAWETKGESRVGGESTCSVLSMQWLWLIAEKWLFIGAFSLRRHVSRAVVQHDSRQELAVAFPLEATSTSGSRQEVPKSCI